MFEDSHHWVYLDRLGKFWLCPKHADDSTFLWTEDVGYVYIGKAGERLVLGPYPYDLRGGAGVSEPNIGDTITRVVVSECVYRWDLGKDGEGDWYPLGPKTVYEMPKWRDVPGSWEYERFWASNGQEQDPSDSKASEDK